MAIVSNEERNVNYDNFIDRLDLEVQRARRYERVVSLCIISIDGADTRTSGRSASKDFLREFTQVVLNQARNVDISVTISSEEFALILPETGFQNALLAAERIKKALEKHEFESGDTKKITVCIGVSAFPDHSTDSKELARRAMQAASLATKSGGNAVRSASDL